MTVTLVIITATYLAVAGLVALNSAFEAERPILAARDIIAIALTSMAWPLVGCVLISATRLRSMPARPMTPTRGVSADPTGSHPLPSQELTRLTRVVAPSRSRFPSSPWQ